LDQRFTNFRRPQPGPANIEYLTAQNLHANIWRDSPRTREEDLLQNQPVEAMAEFRTALNSIRKTVCPAARA